MKRYMKRYMKGYMEPYMKGYEHKHPELNEFITNLTLLSLMVFRERNKDPLSKKQYPYKSLDYIDHCRFGTLRNKKLTRKELYDRKLILRWRAKDIGKQVWDIMSNKNGLLPYFSQCLNGETDAGDHAPGLEPVIETRIEEDLNCEIGLNDCKQDCQQDCQQDSEQDFEQNFEHKERHGHLENHEEKKEKKKQQINNDVLTLCLYLFFHAGEVKRPDGEIIMTADYHYPRQDLETLREKGFIKKKDCTGYIVVTAEGAAEAKRLKEEYFGGGNDPGQ